MMSRNPWAFARVLLMMTSLYSRGIECKSSTPNIIIGIYMPTTDWSESIHGLIDRLWDPVYQEPIVTSNGASYMVTYLGVEGRFEPSVQGIHSALDTLKRESISILIGPHDSIARLVTSELNIAYLVIDCRYGDALPSSMTSQIRVDMSENVLFISPRCDVISRAAADVAMLYKWRGTALLYNTIQGLMAAELFITEPEMVTGAFLISSDPEQLLYQLLEIKRLNVDQLIVACETKSFNILLKQALRLSMLSDRYYWLYLSLNALSIDFSPYVYTQVNLTSFLLPNLYDQPSRDVVTLHSAPSLNRVGRSIADKFLTSSARRRRVHPEPVQESDNVSRRNTGRENEAITVRQQSRRKSGPSKDTRKENAIDSMRQDSTISVSTKIQRTEPLLPILQNMNMRKVSNTTDRLVSDDQVSRRRRSVADEDGSRNIFLESLMYDSLRLSRDSLARYLDDPGAGRADCQLKCESLQGGELVKIMKSEMKSRGGVDTDGTNTRVNSTLKVLSLTYRGLEEIGLWKEEGENVVDRLTIKKFTDIPKYQAPSPLKRGVQRIVTLLDSPFVQYKSDYLNRSGNDRYEGFLIDLIEEISHHLKFKYELYESPDGNYGSKNSSGHWNGMIHELIVGNAAMCLGAISITSDRLEVIDFSKPFKMKTFNFLMKKPEIRATIFQFLSPLSAFVWVAIFASLIGVSVLLHIMDRFSPNDPANPRDGSGSFSVQESFWFVYGSLVGGGTERIPRTVSGRLLSSAWWFFGLIIISSYTANLAAFLTISKIDSPIHSVDDLAKQTTIKYGTVRNTYAMSMFKNSDLEVLKKMWSVMQLTNSLVNNTAEGIERAKQGNYAFIWDSPINKHIANHDCDVIATGEPFDEKGYGIGVPDRASYREQLSKVVLSLSESGYLKKIENKWWDAGECEDFSESSKSNDNAELNMYNVAGVFLLLGSGAIMGVIVCLLEYTYARVRKAYKVDAKTSPRKSTDMAQVGYSKNNGDTKGTGIILGKKDSPDDGCPSNNSTSTASSHNINESCTIQDLESQTLNRI